MTVTLTEGEAETCLVQEGGDSRVCTRGCEWEWRAPRRPGRHPGPSLVGLPAPALRHLPLPAPAEHVSFQQILKAEEPGLPGLRRPSGKVSQTTDWGPRKHK